MIRMRPVDRDVRRLRGLPRRLGAAAVSLGLVLSLSSTAVAAGPAGQARAATVATAGQGVTIASVPPMPTQARLTTLKVHWSNGKGYIRFMVTWHELAGAAAGFRLIGVTRCVRSSKAHNGTPCVTAGMHLAASDEKRIARFGGGVRSAIVTISADGYPVSNVLWSTSRYYAILLGAYNSSGESSLKILKSSDVCWQCLY